MEIEARDIKEELEKWVADYTLALYEWAFLKTSSTVLAEDFVQETFLAAAEKHSTFRRESSPKTWLFSILNNKIVDYYRRKSKKVVTHDTEYLYKYFDSNGKWIDSESPKDWAQEESEANLIDNKEFLEVLKKCLDHLPDNWSTCVKLKYLSGEKGKDVCKELGITPSNYWQMIRRAKIQLRECVEENWFNN